MTSRQVTVVVRLKAKPGMEGRVEEELRKLLAPTRLESGCLNYDMHRGADDDSLFLFHENWASDDALKRHFETPHIRHWVEQAEMLLAQPMELTLWHRVG